MTDRKLPVILRPIYIGHRGGNILAMHFHPDGVASFENTWSDGYMEHLLLETVKYEPAVPRCKTCGWFRGDGLECDTRGGLRGPVTEVDHCSRHSELWKR